MHELAIAESMLEAICDRAGRARVTRVILEIGALSGVEPEAIRFCFEVCARGTCAENARLECREVKGLAHCGGCQNEVEVDGLVRACPCGSLDLEMLGGDRLLLKAVEPI